LGTHRITAQLRGGGRLSREVLWQRANENQFELNA
jgi:hypothetical protein